MAEDLISGIVVLGLVGAGAYIRWAVAPVLVAFELGRLFERKARYARRMSLHEKTAAR